MSLKSFDSLAAFVAVVGVGGLVATSALAQITIPTVPVGNPGNAADPSTGGLYGSVAYAYNIGTTEVTNAQYAAFLNAKARTDTYSLYNTNMASGITRSLSAGSYTYSTVSGRANHPVNYVSFWDAARFANWLHNGQGVGAGSGDTETGAYTLGGVTNPMNASVTRNAGAQWAVTSEDEWYKAAYHQPANAGGDIDNYWLYPTSSNAAPAPGNPPAGQANYNNVIGNTTPVASYAANFYGTFDMGGNVLEWNDTIVNTFGSNRGLRGGSWNLNASALRADTRDSQNPANEFPNVGFRVSQVPGPSSVALLAIGGLAAVRRRR